MISEMKVAEAKYSKATNGKNKSASKQSAWTIDSFKAANADSTSYHERSKASIPDGFRFEKSSRFNRFYCRTRGSSYAK